jgi:CheY-like chemotaxis protein
MINEAMSAQHVLLVEDNNIDARLFEQALKIARPHATVTHVPDVLSATYYLRGIGFYADRTAYPLPYLVVIDLQLENVNGMELLKWIQKEPAMCGLITLVLTASDEYSDAATAYAHGANSYLKKLHDRDALANSLTLLHAAWLEQDLLPPNPT